ncbi:Odorant receptor 27 [Ephemera danica]|nr:Odorant receptor 27 [Ephemera danica]
MLQGEGIVPLGVRAVVFCNRLAGFWLPIPVSPWHRLFLFVFECLVILINAATLVVQIIKLYHVQNFVIFLIWIGALLKYSYTVILSIYLLISKKNIEQIFKDAQGILKNKHFYYYQVSLLNRTSKRIVIYLTIPFLCFIALQICSITFTNSIMKISTTTNVTTDQDKFIKAMFLNNGTFFDQALIILTLISNILSQFKSIAVDAMFLGLLYFVSEQLNVLKITLRDAMTVTGKVSSFKRTDLQTWLNFQSRIARLTNKINATWSFVVVLVFICTTLITCFLSYVMVKLPQLGIVTYISLAYWLLSLLPIFLYCHAGHRLRIKGEEITEAACRGPWMQMNSALVPGVHLIALDCSRSFVARGGPFFTLSLEFFASVMGAVLTYLVVLLQVV